jgi:hypothetical protein
MVDLARGWSCCTIAAVGRDLTRCNSPVPMENTTKTAVFGSFEARNATSKSLKEFDFMVNSAT